MERKRRVKNLQSLLGVMLDCMAENTVDGDFDALSVAYATTFVLGEYKQKWGKDADFDIAMEIMEGISEELSSRVKDREEREALDK